jgi:hypothetical protein
MAVINGLGHLRPFDVGVSIQFRIAVRQVSLSSLDELTKVYPSFYAIDNLINDPLLGGILRNIYRPPNSGEVVIVV